MVIKYSSQALFFLLYALVPCIGLAQYTCDPSNSTFSKFVTCTNKHLEQTNYYDPLQRRYAAEFYKYYVAHPDSEIAKEAFLDALVMWMNLNEEDKIEDAIKGIDLESEIWNDLVPTLIHSNFFQHMYGDSYREWLTKLSTTLNSPEALTIVLAHLAVHFQREGNEEKVAELYHQIDRLNADLFYTENARYWLYDYEVLGQGMEAPAFEVTSIGEKKIKLSDQRGKVVVLFFWYTDCGSLCDMQIEELKKLRSGYTNQELEIIWLSLEKDGQKLVDQLEEFALKPPQFWLPEGTEHEIAKLYNVKYGLRTVLIDQQGKIAEKNLWIDELNHAIALLVKK